MNHDLLQLEGVTDRLFALRRVAPFDRLRDFELLLIAEVALPRSYERGITLGAAGRPLDRLQVVVEGGFETHDGAVAAKVLGLSFLLYGRQLTASWIAGSEGALVLEIRRGHLFTILHECPELVLGFMSLDAFADNDSASGFALERQP